MHCVVNFEVILVRVQINDEKNSDAKQQKQAQGRVLSEGLCIPGSECSKHGWSVG